MDAQVSSEPVLPADYGRCWTLLKDRLDARFLMAREVLEEQGMGDVAALIPIEEVLIWMKELEAT